MSTGRFALLVRGVAFPALLLVTACSSSDDGTPGSGLSTSPGTATIEFTVDGAQSYCAQSACGEAPSIDIEDSSGHSLFAVTSSCESVSCDTCSTTPCPGFACMMRGIAVTGAKLQWNGAYNVNSTCGAGKSCVAVTYAKPGKYTAKFCATPGKLVAPDGGGQQSTSFSAVTCETTGPAQCGAVDFEFPSSTTVRGTVGSSGG
jgi:hypothetical protein